MKIAVAGLWHLGCVTAACCAKHFEVAAFDLDQENIARLKNGKAPLFEPGLDELIGAGLASNRLSFSERPSRADLLWITYDTPVNESDEPDVAFVFSRIRSLVAGLDAGSLVLISSQLAVGSCARLELEFPALRFAYSPENLRLGKSIAAFENPERIVIGIRDESAKALLTCLFAPFSKNLMWMKTESAEMLKHGLNSFLALSIAYINEVAALCEKTGADAREVAAGLKSDERVGSRAYLSPGGAFAGATLARDVVSLIKLGEEKGQSLDVILAIRSSNDRHRGWALRRIRDAVPLEGLCVAVLGLAYTAGTDTLRRSESVELCRTLHGCGVRVVAHDPVVRELPEHLEGVVVLCRNVDTCLADAGVIVIGTPWPQLRELDWPRLAQGKIVLDANGFLEREFAASGGTYFRVGKAN